MEQESTVELPEWVLENNVTGVVCFWNFKPVLKHNKMRALEA